MLQPRRSRHGHTSDVGSRSGCKPSEPLRAEFDVFRGCVTKSQRTRRARRNPPIKLAGVCSTRHPCVRLASRDAAGRTPPRYAAYLIRARPIPPGVMHRPDRQGRPPHSFGGGSRPNRRSMLNPMASKRRSLLTGPSSSSPTGRPELVKPTGRLSPGMPALLPGSVLRMYV